jgi:nucleoside triphosphatase
METKQQYPEPTVGALIINTDGKLLLVKTHKWKGKYTIPGGHVELGERLLEALSREIYEETGLEMIEAEYLCFQEFVYDECFWKQRHFIFFDFICRVKSGDIRLNEEAEEYVWVDVKEAHSYPIDPYLRYALELYQQRLGKSE